MEEVEPKLNNFVTTTEDIAHAAAKKAEKAILNNDSPGLLHGLPISIKDLIAMGGVRCTFGSKASADNIAALDAPAVERVRKEGGVIIGKTTTSEFGCKAVGDSPLTQALPAIHGLGEDARWLERRCSGQRRRRRDAVRAWH